LAAKIVPAVNFTSTSRSKPVAYKGEILVFFGQNVCILFADQSAPAAREPFSADILEIKVK
jgi:hypothetical protein